MGYALSEKRKRVNDIAVRAKGMATMTVSLVWGRYTGTQRTTSHSGGGGGGPFWSNQPHIEQAEG